jgi:hypothetical protein
MHQSTEWKSKLFTKSKSALDTFQINAKAEMLSKTKHQNKTMQTLNDYSQQQQTTKVNLSKSRSQNKFEPIKSGTLVLGYVQSLDETINVA